MLVVFLFAVIGLFMVYFLISAVLGAEVSLESIPTLAVLALLTIVLLFFLSGLNGGLAMAYRAAFGRTKTSLARFYSYSLSRTPVMFAIFLASALIWLFLCGPAIAVYYYFLKDMAYMDILFYGYVLFITFTIQLLFTPALISAGAFNTSLYSSMRNNYLFLKNKHVYFLGLYLIFALIWLLNFIPLVQIFTIFAVYPIIYTAMIVMMESGIKIKKEEE